MLLSLGQRDSAVRLKCKNVPDCGHADTVDRRRVARRCETRSDKIFELPQCGTPLDFWVRVRRVDTLTVYYQGYQ
jgi:hypothetical protein